MQNKYPLWKNIALILLAIVGFIYAIPNIFSEEPAVQISSVSSQSQTDIKELSARVKNLLDSSKIHYRSLSSEGDRVEVRFASTDTQLAVQDLIKNKLGQNYTVALNLMPSTPKWLSVLGAEPMKQGL